MTEDSLHGVYFSEDTYLNDTIDWIVGDRVWVDGVKPGYIQFIGETHFADGDWAGVVLDEPIGKNSGSVSGRRYFYCEPKRGIFTRLHRLSRFPFGGKMSPDSGISEYPNRRIKTTSFSTKSPIILDQTRQSRSSFRLRDSSPPRFSSLSPSPVVRNRHFSLSPRPKTVTRITTTTTTLDGPYIPGPLRVGDKVFVNSSRGLVAGKLRFMGTTSFASGQWAGIELDKPVGKNDGQVAGKRYFICKPLYGLFTPVYKVVKADPNRMTTITRTVRADPRMY